MVDAEEESAGGIERESAEAGVELGGNGLFAGELKKLWNSNGHSGGGAGAAGRG
jgi:hypothetical protein